MSDEDPRFFGPPEERILVTETTTVVFSTITFVISPVFPTEPPRTMIETISITHTIMQPPPASPRPTGSENRMQSIHPTRHSSVSDRLTLSTAYLPRVSTTPVAAAPTPSKTKEAESAGTNRAALIGGIAGGIAFLIWMALFIAFCIHYYRRRKLQDVNERRFSAKTRGTSGSTEAWGGGAFGGIRSPEMNRRSDLPDIKIEHNVEDEAVQTDPVDVSYNGHDSRFLDATGTVDGMNGSGKKLSRIGLRWSTTQESMTVPYHLRIFRPRSELTTSSIGNRPTTPSTMGGPMYGVDIEEQPLPMSPPPPMLRGSQQLRTSQQLRSINGNGNNGNGNGQRTRRETPSQIGMAVTSSTPSPSATPAVSVASDLPILSEAVPPATAENGSSSSEGHPSNYSGRNFVFSLGKSGDKHNPDTQDTTSRVQRFLAKKSSVEVTTSSSEDPASARSSEEEEHPSAGVSYLRVPEVAATKQSKRRSLHFYKRWSGGAISSSSSSKTKSIKGKRLNWTAWWDSDSEGEGDESRDRLPGAHKRTQSNADTLVSKSGEESMRRKKRLSR